MKTSFQGIGEMIATFEAGESVAVGSLVKVSANGKVDVCADTDPFCGVVVNIRGGYAAVQIGGYAQIPCTGGVAVGYQTLCAGADGKAKTGETGRQLLVVDYDSTAAVCGVIL